MGREGGKEGRKITLSTQFLYLSTSGCLPECPHVCFSHLHDNVRPLLRQDAPHGIRVGRSAAPKALLDVEAQHPQLHDRWRATIGRGREGMAGGWREEGGKRGEGRGPHGAEEEGGGEEEGEEGEEEGDALR